MRVVQAKNFTIFVGMVRRLERTWHSGLREAVRFLAWGASIALVCFLLYRVTMNGNRTHLLCPMSGAARDSLMAVAVPTGVADTLVMYDAFMVHFNGQWGIANCAAYEMTRAMLDGDAQRADGFMRDASVAGCPEADAYAGSGLHRGHLVPASDMKGDEQAMRQTFFMTNICPMSASLNTGGWAKLEEKVREWTARDSALLVFAGPVVSASDTTLAGSRVRVPGHYYKVVMAPCVRPVRAIAFIYPNGASGGRLSKYAVSVDEVERLTGLDFFGLLPQDEQQRTESVCNLDAWLN